MCYSPFLFLTQFLLSLMQHSSGQCSHVPIILLEPTWISVIPTLNPQHGPLTVARAFLA